MKTISISIIFIFWMIISLILVCSLVGLILFIPKDNYQNQDSTPSTWAYIGRELLKTLTK